MLSAGIFALFALIVGSDALVAPRAACADGTVLKNAACCAWIPIRNAMIDTIFEGICGENAHSTIRIAFHDAAGISVNGGKGGGADGSMIAFGDIELAFASNAGIDDIVTDLQPFADQHHISYGDVIQFGAAVALSLCPGAPIVQTFVGRKNATGPAPDGTLPDPQDTITSILARFDDMGHFTPAQVVALVGSSHSAAAQDEIHPEVHGSPFDSTPGQFDSQVFLEVQLRGSVFVGDGTTAVGQVASGIAGELRLQSDHNLARDSRTSCVWQSFALNQQLMASSFASAMGKLALLGHSASALTDCTEVIQAAPPTAHKQAFFPPGTTHADIEQACATELFPTTLLTMPGSPLTIPVVPTQ